MQIHRTAHSERRSDRLKKVTTSPIGFNPLLPGAHINEPMIASVLSDGELVTITRFTFANR